MYGQVTEPTVQRKFLKVSKTHTYGGIFQDATSLYIPDMFTNVHSKTRCGRINITYKNEAKCRQLFACSQLGANTHIKLSEHEGMLFRGEQIVVPHACQKRALTSLHIGHLGTAKCTERAKTTIYWPGYMRDIQDLIE